MTHSCSIYLWKKPALFRALFLSVMVLFGALLLPGCQSEQDRKIAEAKELARQQAETPSPPTGAPGKDAPPVDYPAKSSETQSGGKPAAVAPPKLALSLPVYPGAIMSGTEGAALGQGESGINMALLETHASPDEVIAFYQKQLEYEEAQPDGKGTHTVLPPVKENRLDGKRVAIITRPQKDGGLQTVEVREGEGKTLIQLLEVKAGILQNPQSLPTGMPPDAGTSSKRGPLDQQPIR